MNPVFESPKISVVLLLHKFAQLHFLWLNLQIKLCYRTPLGTGTPLPTLLSS